MHQKLMGSILGRDPAPIQVCYKSVQQFLYNPVDKQTNKRTRMKTDFHNIMLTAGAWVKE